MRILQVIQHLDPGGAERTVLSLARRSVAAGHEIAFATTPGRWIDQVDAPHFELPMWHRRTASLLRGVWALRRAVRAWQPDLVHAHNPGMALTWGLARLPRRRPASLVTIHGLAGEEYAPAARVLRVFGLPVVGCSPHVSDALAAYGLRTTMIMNGASPAPPPWTRDDLDARWPALRGRPVVVAAGRLVPSKNHALTIAAMPHLPGVALLVVGDGVLERTLQAQAASVAPGRVVFTGYRADVREIMSAADAIVIASHYEGFPLIALEAFACGLPLVAARSAWQSGLVVDGRHARIVPQNDVGALATAVRSVLEDRELAARLSSGGRAFADDYDDERVAREYLPMYERLVSDARPATRTARRRVLSR
jgi:glycosyltransferase involved in cell wall biosynthesis